jgi:hypothetical protein
MCAAAVSSLMVFWSAPAAFSQIDAVNVQEGDNSSEVTQSGTATSGDAISGGQVIATVTSGGGNTEINATNFAEDTDAESGDVRGRNSIFSTTGQVSIQSQELTQTEDTPATAFVDAGGPVAEGTDEEAVPVGPPGPEGPSAASSSTPQGTTTTRTSLTTAALEPWGPNDGTMVLGPVGPSE